MTNCKNCRALELISDGIRRGHIVSFKISEPRYNCALGKKIVIIEDKPYCENCAEKTTRRKYEVSRELRSLQEGRQ